MKKIIFVCLFSMMYHPVIDAMKRKTENITPHHTCAICNTSFRNLSLLQQHELTHVDERPYACRTCHQTFKSLYHLNKHDIIHPENIQYTCTTCYKNFVSLFDLNTHKIQLSHDKPYAYPPCDKRLKQKKNVAKHIIDHPQQTIYIQPCIHKFSSHTPDLSVYDKLDNQLFLEWINS